MKPIGERAVRPPPDQMTTAQADATAPGPDTADALIPPAFTDPTRTAGVGGAPPPPGTCTLAELRLPPPPTTDGRRFCAEVLAEIRARTQRGERCQVVFDIDNTLVDTRWRTVEAAHRFGERHDVPRLRALTLDEAGVDGRATCLGLGFGPGALTDTFHAFWSSFFWNPAAFGFDQPIAEVVALAREASAAGAEVFYLTGRIAALKPATLAQLERLGLPNADAAHLACKPSLEQRTPRFKELWLREALAGGAHLGFFFSEGSRDLAHLRATLGPLPLVRLDFPVDTPGVRPPADAPVFALDS